MIDVDPAQRPTRPGRWRRSITATAVALGALLLLAAPASAEDPNRMQSDLVDTAGVLGTDTAKVQDALDSLQSDTGYQLFVAFVNTFSGQDALAWADSTAELSGLGTNDLLLAVAVQDRAYALSVDPDLPLTDAQLAEIERATETHLGTDDWAGAAIAAADGIRDALGGGSGAGGGGIRGWLVLALVGLVVVGGIWFLSSRRASRAGAGTDPNRLPTPELSKRAGVALVELDDAVKSSEQELGFAQAQFGVETTRAFGAVVERAKAALTQAFALRQQLDDAQPETEQQARAMMTQILDLCGQADAQLDAQAEEFTRLRDLQNRAPQALTETAQRATEVSSRLAGARATLASLATSYSPTALASVAGNPDHAEQLLTAAHESVRQGQAAVDTDRAAAVGLLRAAEDAVEQAVRLLDAVDHARADLAEAGAKVDAGLASISADVADADRLARENAGVTAAAQAARQAIADATAARDGGDQLAALTRLTTAEAALDAALAPLREEADRLERARTQLATTLGQVTSQIRAVSSFIETRRGAVGAQARTQLAEAARLAQEAERTSATDPAAALAQAQQAGQYAASAQDLANRDVSAWDQQRSGSGGGLGGGLGGGGGLDSMILGGILRGGGGGGGSWGGGITGGGFGGSSRSSRSPSRSSGGFSIPRSSGGRSSGGGIGGGRRSSGGRSRGGRF